METIKKQIILLALMMSITITAAAQFNVSYSAGYGTYEMGDMSNMLEQSLSAIRGQMPDGLKITDNFPGYITHNIDLAYRLNRHEFGLKGSYFSTGGKTAYADYSGRYHEKLLLDAYRVGLMYRFHFFKLSNIFSLYGELSPGITFSSLDYDVLLELPDYEVKETDPGADLGDIKSGYSILPMIGAQFQPIRHLYFQAAVGYDVEFGAKLNKNKNLSAEWSGIRLQLGVGFTL